MTRCISCTIIVCSAQTIHGHSHRCTGRDRRLCKCCGLVCFFSSALIFIINCFALLFFTAQANNRERKEKTKRRRFRCASLLKMQQLATNNTLLQVSQCPFVSDLFSNILCLFFYFHTFVFIVCFYLTKRKPAKEKERNLH